MCFVACFERFMRFVNRHAYIEIVLRKVNFCNAIFKALRVLGGNMIRFGALFGLVELVLIMGSIFITVLVIVICFYVLKTY